MLCVGVVLSIFAFIAVNRWERNNINLELKEQAGNQAAALERGIATTREVVFGIAELYAASRKVERHGFRDYVKGSLARHSEIQALEWIPRVREAERAAYKEAARRDGLTDFQITERKAQGQMVRASRRDEYFPVYYVEPLEGNEAAVGFDIASNPPNRVALEKARDTGKMVATGRITLVQETGKQFGLLMLQPVYRNNAPHGTVKERRENLMGFALGVFRISDLVEKVLKGVGVANMDVHLYDDSAGPDNRLLYLSLTTQEHKKVLSRMHWRTTIDVADRQWTLLFHPEPEFIAIEKTWQPQGALLGGLLLTALMGAYLLISIRHTDELQSEVFERERAEEKLREHRDSLEIIVENRTAELSDTVEKLKMEITERKQAEEALAQERQNLEVTVERRTEELRQSLATLEDVNLQLQEANLHKSRFLSSLSHELRTPLNAILGFSDLLKGQHYGPMNEKQDEYVSHIESSGRHLLELINDLLDIAKIDAGRMEVHLEPFSWDEMICTVTSLMSTQFNEKRIALEVDVAAYLREASMGDERLCKQIMFNLLSNAVKFTPEGGRVTVRAVEEEGIVQVSVSDTGIGIPRDQQEEIFSEFRRVDDSSVLQQRGTGIGLALTRRLVELMGGEIGVESEPERGSTFTFTLPFSRPAEVPEEVAPIADRAMDEVKRGRRILVAEDNDVNLAMILDMLATQDHEVAVARNGQEAVDLTRSFRPDLVLMDIRMPVMDGLEATRQIRQMAEFATLPIIALTATVGEDARERCFQAGCTAHLAKPVQSVEVFAALATYLESRNDG